MKKLIKPIITILALALGLGVMWHLITSRKMPGRVMQAPISATARVADLVPGSAQVQLAALGEVQAARAVTLSPEVSGRVTYVSPKLYLGGHFASGELLLSIDQTDYKMAVEQAEAAVAQAQVQVEEQEALSVAAAEQVKMMDRRGLGVNEGGKRLASRQAYVDSARAQLKSEQSKLQQARVKLSRCQVKAPFDSMVKSKNVEIGQVVSSGSQLVELVADDEVYVVLSVMLDQLKWLEIPQQLGETGSKVEVVSQTTGLATSAVGSILSQLPELKEKSQLAQLLVSVPQKGAKERLLIGSVVNCTILGKVVDNVVPITRQALRDNEKIYVIDQNKRLAERPVTVLFSDRTNYYLKNDLDLSERLITSRLATPIPGMPIYVEGEARPNAPMEGFDGPGGPGGMGGPGGPGGSGGPGGMGGPGGPGGGW